MPTTVSTEQTTVTDHTTSADTTTAIDDMDDSEQDDNDAIWRNNTITVLGGVLLNTGMSTVLYLQYTRYTINYTLYSYTIIEACTILTILLQNSLNH